MALPEGANGAPPSAQPQPRPAPIGLSRWRIRRLHTRFILAGGLLVMTTIVSGLWSAWTLARLSASAGRTLEASQRTIDLAAALSDALEREDDALLLAVSGDRAQAMRRLAAQRQRFADSFAQLLKALDQPEEAAAAAVLHQHVAQYRAAGDALVGLVGQRDAMTVYYQRVNPALRRAVADCAMIREYNFREMQFAAIRARDAARAGGILVSGISVIALLFAIVVAAMLARSVLGPIRELGSSLEALRAGDFARRVRVFSADEIGELAVGFNRMAEALAEFRRSNLGEVVSAKETLEATIAALPDAVIVIDPEGRTVSRNPLAAAMLQAGGGAPAHTVEDLPFPPPAVHALRAALRGERGGDTRADLSRAFAVTVEGRRRKFMLTVAPIPEFWHDRFGAVAILYDVTELARLDELRTELIAVASHELKTPLTTLRMNLLLLGERADNLSARQREILAMAVLGCQELADTIDELLDLTRIEAGQLRLARDMIDIHAVIDRAIAALRPRFEDAAVTVGVAADSRPALLNGDALRLRMVFTNLLSNALKYTPRGGSVAIAVSSGQDAAGGSAGVLHIAVTDSGCGIPAAFRGRVFDKFFRVEQQIERGEGGHWGAGIGLYLCRQIVEAHGGRIACAAGPDGSGTRIEVVLPLEAREAISAVG